MQLYSQDKVNSTILYTVLTFWHVILSFASFECSLSYEKMSFKFCCGVMLTFDSAHYLSIFFLKQLSS